MRVRTHDAAMETGAQPIVLQELFWVLRTYLPAMSGW